MNPLQVGLVFLLAGTLLLSGCSSEPPIDDLLEQGRAAIKAEDWTEVRRLKNVLADRENADVETQFLEANLYMNVLNHQKVMERVGTIAGDKRIREDCMLLAVTSTPL